MSNLIVNTRDQQFVIFEQLDIENLLQSKRFKDFTKYDLLMIMNEAEKLAVNVIAPTLKEGDQVGAKFQNGKVTAPECFREPFKKFCEGGWLNPMEPPEVGGPGIPFSVGLSVLELFGAANFAFCMYPGLTHGAAGLIHSFGTEEQKNTIYCPEIYIQYMQIN
jgi:alkylation response protein AidB-like acyl-CoA dehydrogenase